MVIQGLERNGVALRYCDEGQRRASRALVFVNSLGTDMRIWVDVSRVFGDTARILRYDLRGQGISDAPSGPYTLDDHVDDLIAIMDDNGVDNAVVVGSSIGGQIALGLALKAPRLVRGLVLCDTAAKIGTTDFWQERIELIAAQGLDPVADSVVQRWFSRSYLETSGIELRLWRNLLLRSPVEGYLGTCAALRDADLSDVVGTIDIPALCLCGDEDGATPPAVVRELSDRIPGAKYFEITRAGHLPCVEQPAIMSQAISSFLSEHALG